MSSLGSWIFGAAEKEEKEEKEDQITPKVPMAEMLKICIMANYFEDHLEKWSDVWSGKYYLSVWNDSFSQCIFKYNGEWYRGEQHRGDDMYYTQLYEWPANQTLISLFLNPSVVLTPFDYDKIKDDFGGREWANSEDNDCHYRYYFLDGKMMVDQRIWGEETTIVDMSSDDIGRFVENWINEKENFHFTEKALPIEEKEEKSDLIDEEV